MKKSRKTSLDIYLDGAASIFDIGHSNTLHGELMRLNRLQEDLVSRSGHGLMPDSYRIHTYTIDSNQHADLVALSADWQVLGSYLNEALGECVREDHTPRNVWDRECAEDYQRIRDSLEHEG